MRERGLRSAFSVQRAGKLIRRLPWAPPCRSAGLQAENWLPVIGGMLLVGIMNLVVSAEVIGRALLQ